MTSILFALQDSGISQVAGWRTIGSLIVVLSLLGGLLWLLKRGGLKGRSRSAITIESAQSLGDRRSVAIVAVEGRRLLVGLAPGQVSFLTELQAAPAFGDAVDQAVGKASAK